MLPKCILTKGQLGGSLLLFALFTYASDAGTSEDACASWGGSFAPDFGAQARTLAPVGGHGRGTSAPDLGTSEDACASWENLLSMVTEFRAQLRI